MELSKNYGDLSENCQSWSSGSNTAAPVVRGDAKGFLILKRGKDAAGCVWMQDQVGRGYIYIGVKEKP